MAWRRAGGAGRSRGRGAGRAGGRPNEHGLNLRATTTTTVDHGERPSAAQARCLGNDSSSGMERVSRSSGSIQGQLLRLSARREVAIYLREGSTWVADFVDGQSVLVDVPTWLRFNCGTPANAYVARRTALESAISLSAELVARIERLHRAAVAPRARLHFIRS
jgi:hypothetical protein